MTGWLARKNSHRRSHTQGYTSLEWAQKGRNLRPRRGKRQEHENVNVSVPHWLIHMMGRLRRTWAVRVSVSANGIAEHPTVPPRKRAQPPDRH